MTPRTFSPTFGLLLVLATLFVPQRASAWGTEGHRRICELAWDELQPAAERGVRRALGVETREAFAARCTHPEILPHDLMGLPANAREIDFARDCPAGRTCPVLEIERASADLTAQSAPPDEAILRLAHFIGEVHQPLSVGYTADRNGLDIPATFLGRPTTMHAIWNDELVTVPAPPRAADTAFDLRVITTFLDRSRWTLSPPRAWAVESYWIMRTPATGYLGNPGGLAFDEVFVAQNKLTAMDQIEKAGIRLAHTLNRAFGDPGANLPGASPPAN